MADKAANEIASWAPDNQQEIANHILQKLESMVLRSDNNRKLNAYLDHERNKPVPGFFDKSTTAALRSKVFVPLITGDMLARMKRHDSSVPDYVLAEWILALELQSKDCIKIIPSFVGEYESDHIKSKELNFDSKAFPDVAPYATIRLILDEVEKVKLGSKLIKDRLFNSDSLRRWSVREVVDTMQKNIEFHLATDTDCQKLCEAVEKALSRTTVFDDTGREPAITRSELKMSRA